jgi:hypothetical protein
MAGAQGLIMPDHLYKLLQRQPSAPQSGFDQFVVGRTANQRAELLALLNLMLSCKEPTCGRLIIGKNGNGKTLLNKSLQEAATNHNFQRRKEGGRPTFDVMFSRVSVSQTGTSNIGVELAKSLRRSYVESPQITYASIAAEVLRAFAETYKSPLSVRLLTHPAKVFLRYALKKYDDYIGDLIDIAAEEGGVEGIDAVFKRIDRRLRNLGLEGDFREFARRQRMSGFLETFISADRREYRTVEELNRTLYNDLARGFSNNQPQDLVASLASMARSVGCKVLMLQIDDCNDKSSVDFLLPIAEHFAMFQEPKILLIASAVEAVWQHNIERGADKSAKQKLDQFFNPIHVSSPDLSELEELARKLELLIQTAEATNGRLLRWPENSRGDVLKSCVDKTYREATKAIIDDAEKYIY